MLELRNLSVGYSEQVVLSDLDLTLELGKIVGIKGKNGSGKSTLLKSIVGLSDIFEGNILYGGMSIIGLPIYQIIHSGIAYVSQQNNLFPDLSIEEHFMILSGNSSHVKRWIYRQYRWIREKRHNKVASLSGGQQRILSILLPLFQESVVLILDEPTAGLDARSVGKIKELIISLRGDRVVLLTEQNVDILEEVSDEVFEVRKGTLY